jgi:hypothetical protein
LTEFSDRRPLRKSLVYGAVAVAAAIALFIAYLIGAFDESGHIQADDVCRNVPDRQATAEIFSSVLPRATKYDFSMTLRPTKDYSYRSSCDARGDGKSLLQLTADMGVAKPWRKWVDDELPPSLEGKRTYFNAGIKGVSTADQAAIYVPCYSSERASKQAHNLTVFALALKPLESADKEARQTLIDLATDFARSAHKEAKCDLPSKLAD